VKVRLIIARGLRVVGLRVIFKDIEDKDDKGLYVL